MAHERIIEGLSMPQILEFAVTWLDIMHIFGHDCWPAIWSGLFSTRQRRLWLRVRCLSSIDYPLQYNKIEFISNIFRMETLKFFWSKIFEIIVIMMQIKIIFSPTRNAFIFN